MVSNEKGDKMENVQKIVLGKEHRVNSYIIENNKECFIIDPGFEKNKLINYVKDNNLIVKAILLTHAHLDHIGSIDAFNVPVYLHEEEYSVLLDDELNCFAHHTTNREYEFKDINIKKLKDGDKLLLGGREIEVIHTPGHTVGGACYKDGNNLYTGDTLFWGTVGKWIFPTGNQEQMKSSIIKLIDSMPEEVGVYPGHGRSSTIGIEKEQNKYYLEWKK